LDDTAASGVARECIPAPIPPKAGCSRLAKTATADTDGRSLAGYFALGNDVRGQPVSTGFLAE